MFLLAEYTINGHHMGIDMDKCILIQIEIHLQTLIVIILSLKTNIWNRECATITKYSDNIKIKDQHLE